MSTLSANLKHLYQRRSYLLLGLFFGFIANCIAGDTTQACHPNLLGRFGVPAIWIFYVSLFVTASSIDILTKPFSFCLPGHRRIPRKFLFSIGLFVAFLWSLSFFLYPGLSLENTILNCFSAFAAFTIFHWLAALLVFRFRNWGIVLATFPLLMVGELSGQFFGDRFNIFFLITQAIVKSPGLMILLGSLVNFFAWYYLGNPDLARRYCGKLWIGAFDAWNKEKMSKFQQDRFAEKIKKNPNFMTLSPRVEKFFILRIIKSKTGNLQQYTLGNIYRSFGIMISQYKQGWINFILLMIPITCLLCYMPGDGKNIIFFMPRIMVMHMSLGVHSSLLIQGGRSQRFWSALILAIVTGVLITITVTLLATITQLLERIMPALIFEGHLFTFAALNISYSLAPLAMMPLTFTIALIFYKKPMLTVLIAIVIFQIFFALSVMNSLTIMNTPVKLGPRHIIITLVCAWAVFVSVLRFISMRCCLVKQTK